MLPSQFEDELLSLDARIRQLKIQYDLFFSGILPRPPVEGRDRLERKIRKIQSSKDMRLAQRFMFNTFLNRWNTYQELWNRRLKAHEEGPRLSALARRRAAQAAAVDGPVPPSPRRPPQKPSPQGLVAQAAIKNISDSAGELKTFYKAFLEARAETGTEKHPSYKKFCKELERHAAAIRQKISCERVDFRLYLQGNKVSLRAKPVDKEENVV